MNENELLKDIGEYLKEKGYNPIVIEFKGVTQGTLKHNFSLIVNFTGTKDVNVLNQDCVEGEK